jgi:hypothetical protein
MIPSTGFVQWERHNGTVYRISTYPSLYMVQKGEAGVNGTDALGSDLWKSDFLLVITYLLLEHKDHGPRCSVKWSYGCICSEKCSDIPCSISTKADVIMELDLMPSHWHRGPRSRQLGYLMYIYDQMT